MRDENYPDWKMKIILRYLPDFSCDTRYEKSVNEFIRYTELFKKQFGHTNIKENDSIDSFDIGRRLYTIKNMYKNGCLSEKDVKKIEELGICLEYKFQKYFNDNLELAKKAVLEGVIIHSKNKVYKERNLYNWVRNSVKKKYRNNSLSNEEIKIIETLVRKPLKDFYSDYRTTEYKKKISLCIQAVNEGVVLTESNRMYMGVNLVSWIKNHKKQFSDDERKIINQVMPPCPQNRPVKIIDIKNHICMEYISISEAGRALYNEFNAVESDNKGIQAIHNRLVGNIKNSIYKERFRFEYADERVN